CVVYRTMQCQQTVSAVPANREPVICRNEKPPVVPILHRPDGIPRNCVCEFRPCGACRRGTERRPGTLLTKSMRARMTRSRGSAPTTRNNEKEKNRMGFFSKDIKTMDDLFVHTLRDIYYAEKQIVQSLREMTAKPKNPPPKQ